MFSRDHTGSAVASARAPCELGGGRAVTLAVVAMFAAMALAASSAAPTVRSATNAKFSEMIVVDAHGRTLYALKSGDDASSLV